MANQNGLIRKIWAKN